MLEGCSFCKDKKFYPMRYCAKHQQQTMQTMLMSLFGTQHKEDYIDEPDGSGVRLFPITDDGYFLEYDNSSDEYADGYFQIHYCPICGRNLDDWMGSEEKEREE